MQLVNRPHHRLALVDALADLDGDGEPEIGVLANPTSYVAYETDGTELWSFPVEDQSRRTGASAFDFDGDGADRARARSPGRPPA